MARLWQGGLGEDTVCKWSKNSSFATPGRISPVYGSRQGRQLGVMLAQTSQIQAIVKGLQ